MIKVIAPASTANLGSGFDCMGIALKLYNWAEFEEIENGVEIDILDDSKRYLPSDENNYIYKAMQRVFNKAGIYPKGVRIRINSDIPVTRGLGSSSASLALGLTGANELIGCPFTKTDLLEMACKIEGHPDNVTPAFLGGFTVSVMDGGRLYYTKTDVPKDISFGAIIPDFYLATKKARGILPKKISHKKAAYNIAHAAYFASSISKGDFSAFSIGVKDKLHQKYRFDFIKDANDIISYSKEYGANASYLSGAGPTIISISDENFPDFEKNMKNIIDKKLKRWHFLSLKADNDGIRIEKSSC